MSERSENRSENKRKFRYMPFSERIKLCQRYNRGSACSNCQNIGIKEDVPWCYEDNPCYFGKNPAFHTHKVQYIPIDLGFDEAFFNQVWEAKK